jgi:hypothetical protein
VGHALLLRHVQRCQAADGVTPVCPRRWLLGVNAGWVNPQRRSPTRSAATSMRATAPLQWSDRAESPVAGGIYPNIDVVLFSIFSY